MYKRKRSIGCSDAIVFENLRFQTIFRSLENETSKRFELKTLKSVFEEHRFRDGFVCMVGLVYP